MASRPRFSKAPAASDPTRAKLIEAAVGVFAEQGYYSATVREICMRAGANVAAVNYYFGGKTGLYTEVLEQSVRAAQLESIRDALHQDRPPEETLRAVLRMRMQSLSRGRLPDWHFRIMAHEMARPSPAMAHMLNSVTRPIYKRTREIVGSIIGLPADHEKTRLCTQSIMGQIFLYVMAGPMLMRLWPEFKMTPAQLGRIADHIADFSLAYLRKERARRPASIRIRRRPWPNNKPS